MIVNIFICGKLTDTLYKSASDNFCVKIKFPMISVEDRKGPVLRINGG